VQEQMQNTVAPEPEPEPEPVVPTEPTFEGEGPDITPAKP